MEKEQTEPKEQVKRDVVTIDGINYAADSLSEEARGMMQDVMVIQEEERKKQEDLNQRQQSLQIVSIAKVMLFEKLKSMTQDFEVVEVVPESEVTDSK